ncbi:MAG: histidine kinase [Eubacteriales bacterium]|nr:histidine kinase [Eubacteriales bacterium]
MKGSTRAVVIVLILFSVAGYIAALFTGGPADPTDGREGVAYDPYLIEFNRGWTVQTETDRYYPESLPFYAMVRGKASVSVFNTLPAHMTGGTFLAFRVFTCLVDVYIGDEHVYSASVVENRGRITPVPGWALIPLAEEYSSRTIRIDASNPYSLHSVTVPEIVIGSHAEVLLYSTGIGYTDYYISVAVIILGILAALFGIIHSAPSRSILGSLCLGGFISLSGMFLLCRSGMTRMDVYQDYVEYIISETSLRLCPVFFALYLSESSPEERRRPAGLFFAVSSAMLAACIVLHLTGVADLTSTDIPVIVMILAELIFSVRHRSRVPEDGGRRTGILTSAGAYCLIASFVLSALPVLDVYESALHARYVLLLVYALTRTAELALSVSTEAERSAILAKELSESRMKIMMSQMQPHFIYNTLTTIRAMIRKSPDKAYRMILEFADYLRFNLNALGNVLIIPVEEELNHTRAYTDIEEARFGDHLRVIYDIRDDSFSVPPLSIQPFVENAVKHGIRKDPEGGTVTVRTLEEERSYVIEVEDDGAGFDTSVLERPEHRGVGIMNAVTRLRSQTGAEVRIDSEKGKGTLVRIEIPKDWRGPDEDDHS